VIIQKELLFSSPDNGFKHAHYHVAGQFDGYSKEDIQAIRKTVVAMLECEDEDVVIDGFCCANSFFVVLGIKEIFINKMLHMGHQHKIKLCDLRVDYFILGGEKYAIDSHTEGKDLL
jgi:hypothetical protein